MDSIIEVIVSALPFLEGFVSQARVVITALPAWGVVAFPTIILLAGGTYLLMYFKLLPNPFVGGSDDDNW